MRYHYKLIALAKNEHDHNHIIGRFKQEYYAERCMNLMIQNEKTWENHKPTHFLITYKNKTIAYK